MAEQDDRSLVEKAREDYGITNADQMQEEQLKAEVDAIDAQADAAPNEGTNQNKLGSLSRKELNARAAEAGVESPEKLPNRDAVIEAIEAKQAE